MIPDLLPDAWPWEILWPATVGVALTTLVTMLVRQQRQHRAASWQQWAVLLVCLLVLVAPFLLFNDLLGQLQRPATLAETSVYATDPTLNTQFFPETPDAVFAVAVRVAQQTPFWRLTVQDPASRLIKAEVPIAFGLLTNDVLIHVDPATMGGTQVNLRASVRILDGDRGTTLRQIVIFYRRLDWALAR